MAHMKGSMHDTQEGQHGAHEGQHGAHKRQHGHGDAPC